MTEKINKIKDLDKRLTKLDNLEALLRAKELYLSNQEHLSQVGFDSSDPEFDVIRCCLLDVVKVKKVVIKKELENLIK